MAEKSGLSRRRHSTERAVAIDAFNELLAYICNSAYHPEIVNALQRPPVRIPAEAFDAEQIHSTREVDADFRSTTRTPLLYVDGHAGVGDRRRHGGELQPEREQMLLHLRKGNRTAYRIRAATDPNVKNTVLWHGSGTLRTQPDGTDAVLVWVCCSSDTVKVEAAEAARVE